MVDLYAKWCAPCKALAPVLEWVADKYAEKIKVVKVNVDEKESIAAKFGIASIPTVIFFENKFMVLSIIFFLLLSYWVCVAAWLLFSELPKYKNGKFPNYYAIWFEREASDMGLNFMLSIRENLNDGNKV